VVIYHARGSGRPFVDAFVYGCTSTNCSLVAVKRSVLVDSRVSPPLRIVVDDERSLLKLLSGQLIELQISLRRE
jgi:hypothetical protein